MNYKNFLVYPSDFESSSFYDMNNISYPDINLKEKIKNKNGCIVLFDLFDIKDFYEILTKGDGSCWYYSTQTVNNKFHLERKLKYLKKNIESLNTNKSIDLKKIVDFISPTNIDEKINELLKHGLEKNIENKLIYYLNEYKYNHIGFGLDIYEVIKETKDLNMEAIIYTRPMLKKQIENIISEIGITKSEIMENDQKEGEIKININSLSDSNKIFNVLFRRGHYSRLIPKNKLSEVTKFTKDNGCDLLVIKIENN